MTQTLLSTKVLLPPNRPDVIARQRLLDLLKKGAHKKLILISAPAGFGKTTLVSQWLNQTGITAAWYSLDENDNDVARFLMYLYSSLKQENPGLTLEVPGALQALHPIAVEAFLIEVINQISGLKSEVVLVLDDYHLIHAEAIHHAVVFLLEHLPPRMHLIIATREDPPLPLSRLRGRGQVEEIRTNQLRFSLEEVTEYLHQVMCLNLSSDTIKALADYTEGWVAGLQMAAVSMQGKEDTCGFIQSFIASNRYILDYLGEEILQKQPENIRNFLLKTSILDYLSAPLCDEVMGEKGSKEILEALEKANLFIFPIDEQHQWYRYHHLFASLLKRQLSGETIDMERIHSRVSIWHEKNGLMTEAIDHAIEAKEYDRSGKLIRKIFPSLILHGEVMTPSRWFPLLPQKLYVQQPELALDYAWFLIITNELGDLENYLQIAESSLSKFVDDSDEKNFVQGQIAAIRAYAYVMNGKMERANECATTAAKKLSKKESVYRDLINWLLLFTQYFISDGTNQPLPVPEAFIHLHDTENLLVSLISLYVAGALCIFQGQLTRADQIYRQGLALVEARISGQRQAIEHNIPLGCAPIYQGLAEIARRRNDLKQAGFYFEKALQYGKEWGNAEVMFDICYSFSNLKLDLGDIIGALEVMDYAESFTQYQNLNPFTLRQLEIQRVNIFIKKGDYESARYWLARGKANEECGGYFNSRVGIYDRQLEVAARTRLDLSEKNVSDTENEILVSIADLEAIGWGGVAIHLRILLAAILEKKENIERAKQVLSQALIQGAKEGDIQPFLEDGVFISQLFTDIAEDQTVPSKVRDFCREILQVLDSKIIEWAAPLNEKSECLQRLPGLIEPLSEREMEVLPLIAMGMSNREIADQLVVTINTVKSHVSSILKKIGAENRTQAIAIARKNHLL